MKRKTAPKTFVCLAVLAGAAVVLSGCDTIREAAGTSKQPPDEFAVVTKAPLIIPPDYNLHPPRPGALPANQSSPTDVAEATLFNPSDTATAAMRIPGNFSVGEKLLLATAGAADADSSIRQDIASDNKSMAGANSSFTDRLLFGGGNDDQGTPVNADAEKKRIEAAQAAGQNPGKTDTQAKPADQSATIQKNDKKSGGWLDGIF
jgi:hypothetical protein